MARACPQPRDRARGAVGRRRPGEPGDAETARDAGGFPARRRRARAALRRGVPAANPPGVGDPETIAARTGSYLLAVGLGAAVVAGGYAAARQLRARGVPPALRQVTVTAVSVLLVAVGYLLLPGSGDTVDAPGALLYDFRVRSLGLVALLYALLGAVFAGLTEFVARRRAADGHTSTRVFV